MKLKLMIFLSLLVSQFAQSQTTTNFNKISIDYIKSLAQSDTSNVYIISDKGELNYIYQDSYLGAYDESFYISYTKQIRIRINNFSNLKEKKFILGKIVEDSAQLEINIISANLYNLENNKIVKNKLAKDLIKYSKNDSLVILDLNSFSGKDSCVIDLKLNFENLSKEQFTWYFQSTITTLNSEFIANIPEIYYYNYTVLSSNDIPIIKENKITYGNIIGYRMPNSKLMSPTFYKRMLIDYPDLRNASKVEYKNSSTTFTTQNVISSKNNILSRVDLKLIEVSAIE